jgi:hypothetical protein
MQKKIKALSNLLGKTTIILLGGGGGVKTL